jgi:hypothetical protein
MSNKSVIIASLFAQAFAIILLIAAVLLGVRIFVHFLDWVAKLDSDLGKAIIAASATGILGIFSVILSQRSASKLQIRESHRPKKTKMYESFIGTISRQLQQHSALPPKKEESDKSASPGTPDGPTEEMLDFLWNMNPELILWASPEVINAYQKFRSSGDGADVSLEAFDDLLKKIRKDLGASNAGLARGELISLFLKPGEWRRYLATKRNAG